MKKLLGQLEEGLITIKLPTVAPIQEKMGGSIAKGNLGPIDGLRVGKGTLKVMLQQFEQTTLNPQLDGHAHGMCMMENGWQDMLMTNLMFFCQLCVSGREETCGRYVRSGQASCKEPFNNCHNKHLC